MCYTILGKLLPTDFTETKVDQVLAFVSNVDDMTQTIDLYNKKRKH